MNTSVPSFLVVSRFNEDISWINNYTSNYIIYNKGEELPSEYNQIMAPNFGGNQYDIFRYIHDAIVPGLKDNWSSHANGLGNHTFVIKTK
jgi:hypothetical protein